MRNFANKCFCIAAAVMALATMMAACADSSSADNKDARPNILFIMSDDHSERAISAYGSTLISTPNIDRIAD